MPPTQTYNNPAPVYTHLPSTPPTPLPSPWQRLLGSLATSLDLSSLLSSSVPLYSGAHANPSCVGSALRWNACARVQRHVSESVMPPRSRAPLRPPPQWSPIATWVHTRFAFHALLLGVTLQGDTEEGKMLRSVDWAAFFTAVLPLMGILGGVHALCKCTQMGPCLLSDKPRSLAVNTKVGKKKSALPAWLEFSYLCKTDGRWAFRFQRDKHMKREFKLYKEGLTTRHAKQQAERDFAPARTYNVHNLICWWAHGKPHKGFEIACHFYCGNKACMNPHHMCWASNQDNRYHRVVHEESRRGMHPAGHHPERHVPDDWESEAQLRA